MDFGKSAEYRDCAVSFAREPRPVPCRVLHVPCRFGRGACRAG